MSAVSQIKPLEASQLTELTEVHMDAFAGYLNTKIGRQYVYKFLEWFHHYPQGIVLVATLDNRPAGYVLGAPMGYQKQMNKDLSKIAMWGTISHPAVWFNKAFLNNLWSRFKVMMRSGAPAPSAEDSQAFSLVGIGVAKWAQGNRLGKALMEAFESEVRSSGFQKMRLSVYGHNTTAKKVYTQNGWSLQGPAGRIEVYSKVIP